MRMTTLPPSFRSAEGRVLRGPVPSDFEAFYRGCLRFRAGARTRTMDLARRYREWAIENEGRSLNMRELRRVMGNIGHRHLKSNGMFYADVQFVEDDPRVPDNFPAALVASEQVPDIARQLDAIMDELRTIRAHVAV